MPSLRGYLRLVRLPNVFTALADVLAGYAISRTWAPSSDADFRRYLPLFGASAALYMAGMAFNDVADRAEDAETRPNRPIPSGQVSVRGAIACAFILMLAGVGLAWWAGFPALLRAAALSAAIMTYNFSAKRNVLMGPLVLGLCRFWNVQLGMTGHAEFVFHAENSGPLDSPWAPAIAVGIYAAGLTAFSAQEEAGGQRRAFLLGWLFSGSAILLAALSSSPAAWFALLPLALTLSFLSHRLNRLGTPQAARDLVRAGVMGICLLDAGLILGFAGTDAWPLAAGCVALLIPGFVFGKALAQKEA
ncbi:MAG: UbiA family prenyltransferase [Planctomycetota bacterium]|nr:UbiA family prenyltransferase [Planctomycetota bacterium]